MSEILVSEGIVIRTIPFRDHDRIITLFTEEQGLLKLYVKRSPPFCAALHRVEISIEKIRMNSKSSKHRSCLLIFITEKTVKAS